MCLCLSAVRRPFTLHVSRVVARDSEAHSDLLSAWPGAKGMFVLPWREFHFGPPWCLFVVQSHLRIHSINIASTASSASCQVDHCCVMQFGVSQHSPTDYCRCYWLLARRLRLRYLHSSFVALQQALATSTLEAKH